MEEKDKLVTVVGGSRRSFFKKLGAAIAAVAVLKKLPAPAITHKNYVQTFQENSLPSLPYQLSDIAPSGVYSITGVWKGSSPWYPLSG